ncbi:MAG: PHP domain-containing protein [Pseudomonadales bacterium]
MKFDLHLHTTASDGNLSPAALLDRAQDCGIDVLAITDHDTVAGVLEAQRYADSNPALPVLVTGVEFSCRWVNLPVHVVGLNMQIENTGFGRFIDNQQSLRAERNDAILSRLEKLGVGGIRSAVGAEQSANLAQLGRPQIADAMVALGKVSDRQRAFKQYLANGKPASVAISWPSLSQTVEAINAAGGDAVVAHPLHYRLTGSKLHSLLKATLDCGGAGFEIIGSGQNPEQRAQLARLARKLGARCSIGSDFHTDQAPWQALGKLPDIPEDCVPIWQDWSVAQ